MAPPVTRIAPSPTGTLHLGNIRTFLINWALARQRGWTIVLRMEDLDSGRVRPGADAAIIGILQWLGIDFDIGPIYQSRDLEPYRQAMRMLTRRHLAYSCALTRSQIRQAVSAPHAGQAEPRFPLHLRATEPQAFQFAQDDINYRFVVPDLAVEIHDEVAGPNAFHPFNDVGDFILWTRLGVPAYQLAVVVDDARQGVTDVVRGDDLLPSAARQALLYRALGLAEPRWWHLPLVLAPGGARLAKRDNALHLERCREAGVRPQRVVGLLARWSGISSARDELSADEFRNAFRIEEMPRESVIFRPEDHQWLIAG